MLSAFGYTFFFLFFYFNPKLQVHPMPLIMTISFVGAATFFSYFIISAMCVVKTYKVMAASFSL
jgi:hypothetical protein